MKLCKFCLQLGELSEAEDALAEANILNNTDPEVWAYLSLVCLRTGRQVEAEQAYKYSLKVSPHSGSRQIAGGGADGLWRPQPSLTCAVLEARGLSTATASSLFQSMHAVGGNNDPFQVVILFFS